MMTASVTPLRKPRAFFRAPFLLCLASVAVLGCGPCFGRRRGTCFRREPAPAACPASAYAQGIHAPGRICRYRREGQAPPFHLRSASRSIPARKMMGLEGDLPFPPNSQMERFLSVASACPEGPQTPEEARQ